MLPDDLCGGSRAQRRKLYLGLAAAFLIAALAGTYAGFLQRLHLLKNEVVVIEQQLAELAPRVEQVKSLQKERASVQARFDALNNLSSQRRQWVPVLAEIHAVLPADIWLTAINIDGDASGLDSISPGDSDIDAGENQKETAKNEEFGDLDRHAGAGMMPGAADITEKDNKRANTVTIEGQSAGVSAVGIYLEGLRSLKYFQDIHLDSMQEGDKQGIVLFVITAEIDAH